MTEHINHPEHRQQVTFFQIMDLLADVPETYLTFSVPNGAKFSTKFHGRLVKAEGMRKGVPDILLPISRRNYNGLAIEMKIPPNKRTKEQVIFQERLEKENWWVIHECPTAKGAFDTWAWYVNLEEALRDRVKRNFFIEDFLNDNQR